MDLRRRQRFPVHFQSMFSGPRREEYVGTVKNLSKSGCFVETDGKVYSGMQVSLRLHVPGETAPILISRAAVRWCRGREVGVGFLLVVPPHQQRLDQFLLRLKDASPESSPP